MDLEVLLGEKITMPLYNKQEEVTFDSTLGQIAKKSFIGGKIVSFIKKLAFNGQDVNDATTKAFMQGFDNQTFRSIVLGSSGRLNKELAEKLLKTINGEFLESIKEIKSLLKDFENM